jgi:hypothetical protein
MPIKQQKVQEEGVFVFCYGSNHPISLSKLLAINLQDFLARSISASLNGYGRVFVGLVPN